MMKAPLNWSPDCSARCASFAKRRILRWKRRTEDFSRVVRGRPRSRAPREHRLSELQQLLFQLLRGRSASQRLGASRSVSKRWQNGDWKDLESWCEYGTCGTCGRCGRCGTWMQCQSYVNVMWLILGSWRQNGGIGKAWPSSDLAQPKCQNSEPLPITGPKLRRELHLKRLNRFAWFADLSPYVLWWTTWLHEASLGDLDP